MAHEIINKINVIHVLNTIFFTSRFYASMDTGGINNHSVNLKLLHYLINIHCINELVFHHDIGKFITHSFESTINLTPF